MASTTPDGAVVEHARDELQLLLGDAHQRRRAERIEQLDAAKRGAEVPGAVLEVDADPVGAGAGRRLHDERLGDR